MATHTKTIPTRKYDHLYDPNYIVSGARDYYRADNRAAFGHIERVPDSQNLFSDVSHYPRHEYRLAGKEELPHHISRVYSSQQTNQANLDVSGPNRCKFFRRPVVPTLQSAPQVVLAKQPKVELPPPASPEPPQKTVAVQTVYRESEAQTDPYTPDFVIPEGENPQILDLAQLNFASGMAPGLKEVELVEKQRQRREFEQSLPPPTDEMNFELRRRLMEQQEYREWQDRENEINKMQNERLHLLESALRNRDQERQFRLEQRIETLRQEKLEEKDKRVAAIQRKRIQALRNLSKSRKTLESEQLGTTLKPKKRDVIGEYSNFASNVYAPTIREGKVQTKKEPIPTQSLSNLSVIETLESTMAPSMTQTNIQRPKLGAKFSASQARKEATISMHLDRMDALLKRKKEGQEGDQPMSLLAQRKQANQALRPPTPRVAWQGHNDRLNAVVLLQRLLRGRAVQNMLFEGKEQNYELVQELRLAEDLLGEKNVHEKLEEQRKNRMIDTTQRSTVNWIIGEVSSHALDFMEKEHVRLQQEKIFAALSQRAEKERQQRESKEMGRRQAEANVRARADIVYEALNNTNLGTAEALVNKIVENAINGVSTKKAMQQIPIAHENVEKEVREIVLNHIVSEVQRQQQLLEEEIEDKRFKESALTTVLAVLEEVDKRVSETD